MCDTLAAVAPATRDGAVWFAKNSDREPGEAQRVEHLPPRRGGARVTATHLQLDDVAETHEVVISRPAWMWGAEMGANARGLAIGNEAVFTKLPVAETGLTGMDLVRLALERASSSREALELICALIAAHGQGGAAGHTDKRFRYHNSFLLADPREAWVLETAGPFWAAERVRGVRTISNGLTIGKSFDLLAPGAYEHAKREGWCRSASDFDFARAFGDPLYAVLAGGRERRACTTRLLSGAVDRAMMIAALRDHAGRSPRDGWRLAMPCAHASWIPTRAAGQTTGSMIARLTRDPLCWFTGTSSPCLSVFKPVALGGGELLQAGPPAGERFDPQSLWWRHEQLHRAVLRDYDALRSSFEPARAALEARALDVGAGRAMSPSSSSSISSVWEEHRAAIAGWRAALPRSSRASLYYAYWARRSRREGMPV